MISRRSTLMLLSGSLAAPRAAFAATPREITWDDLLPPGVPYSEIIGEGELDEVNDTWNPIYGDRIHARPLHRGLHPHAPPTCKPACDGQRRNTVAGR